MQKPLAERIEFVAGDDTLAPGIELIATPGHTPGHVSLLITQGEQRLYLLGDVLHGAMQITEPDWSVAFDIDPEAAQVTRDGLYADLVQPNTLVALNHFSNAVFGRIVGTAKSRSWELL